MLISLLDEDKYGRYNVDIARLLGLDTAVYLNIITNIQAKAIAKNRLTDNMYVHLNRDYVEKITTLDIAKQLSIDKKLKEADIININDTNHDLIHLNLDFLVALIANDDKEIEQGIKKITKLKKDQKQTKQDKIVSSLKNNIKCTNVELRSALEEWVDSVYARPGAFLSKVAIEAFEEKLNNFTKGDLDLALCVTKIASINSWKDCSWAINSYLKDQQYTNQGLVQQKIESKPLEQSMLSGRVF